MTQRRPRVGRRRRAAASVTLVGAGLTGSHAAALVARSAGMERLVIVDPDYYGHENRHAQAFAAADVGKAKALVQARRARRIAPHLAVTPIVAAIEDVPLAAVQADVLLGCLDSRRARMAVNEMAWRLGVPWIDAAVAPAELLVRIAVFQPGADAPCLECAWNDADYRAVEQTFPCTGRQVGSAPTRGPASLGAHAAALQVIECQKLLRGNRTEALVGRQLLVDDRRHQQHVTALSRNPDCRFDHETWRIERWPDPRPLDQVTLGDLFGTLERTRTAVEMRVRLADHGFARRFCCAACGTPAVRPVCLVRRIPARMACPVCRGPLTARGFDQFSELTATTLAAHERRRSLRAVGFRSGDVITARGRDRDAHFAL